MSEHTKSVAIIGTGLIGRGWAVVFARAGYAVRLWDGAPAAAQEALPHVGESLRDMSEVGLVPDLAAAQARLSVASDLSQALAGAAWAQESVREDADVKRDVCRAMDAAAGPDTILASSTSAIPGSVFLADLPGRDRCIVAHPANPPHLMPVVELAPSPWHADAFVQRCAAFLSGVGQVPVVVRHEAVGFVMNRLQAAVIGEAMSLVAKGVVDPDGLDAVMKHSLGLRWSFLGPFETMDLNAPAGFLDYARRYGSTYATLSSDLTVAAPWSDAAMERIEAARRAATPAGSVTARQRWRDRRLMRLLKHQQDCDREIGA
ncbi:MAG: hypothetical protein BGP06_14075 [Rhizobiales bacterium 65-9]|nr:3-hydroxyacyl-CoA dehydrogenase [Hyphomicrobiales bacterium]OJY36806.1 MAG: hypothetical protein BGP06_14075 [Rhizobiales bacterium 65-9]